jgi:hypothetical protein
MRSFRRLARSGRVIQDRAAEMEALALSPSIFNALATGTSKPGSAMLQNILIARIKYFLERAQG